MRYLLRNTDQKPCVTCGQVCEYITKADRGSNDTCLSHRPLVFDQTIPPINGYEVVQYASGMFPTGTEIVFVQRSTTEEVITL